MIHNLVLVLLCLNFGASAKSSLSRRIVSAAKPADSCAAAAQSQMFESSTPC